MAIYKEPNGRRTYTGADSPREAVRGGVKKMQDSVNATNRRAGFSPLTKEKGYLATPIRPKRPKGPIEGRETFERSGRVKPPKK